MLWNQLYKEQTALCVLSTGTGKTEIFIEFLKKALTLKPELRAIILVNKINLLTQTARRIGTELTGNRVGVFYGKEKELSPITVACIQSIYKLTLDNLNLIILDETHNVDQNDGRYIDFIRNHPAAKLIAFTATPYRTASGPIYGAGKLFTKITYQKQLKEMIQAGFLVEPRMKRTEEQFDISQLRTRAGEFMSEDVSELVSDEKKVRAQVQDAIPRLRDRKSVVWACALISHAEDVKTALGEEGEDAVVLHSKMSEDERIAAQKEFETGLARHLVFVSIVSEGYDHPPIDAVVLMRPMKSPVLYVQTVGRGLRISEGKKDCLILDYGKVVETIGPLDNPKMNDKESRKKKQEPTLMKFCPACLEYVHRKEPQCPACSHVFFTREAPKLEKKAANVGDLVSWQPQKPKMMELSHVELEKYHSKSGNDCLRVTYYPKSIVGEYPVSEFFVWSNDYAQQRLFKRLGEMQVKLCADINEQAAQAIQTMPTMIEYEMDGKYPRVKRLFFL